MKALRLALILCLGLVAQGFGSLVPTTLHLHSLTVIPQTTTNSDKPFARGVFAWDAQGQAPITESNPLVNNASVDGWRVKTRWRDIQTGPASFNWSPIDDSITVAKNHGKKILLSVAMGRNAPDFIFTTHGGNCVPIVLTYKQANDSTTPLDFDPAYWVYADAFIATLGARYDPDTTIAGVYNSGKGELSLEFVVAKQSTDITAWDARAVAGGYTDAGFGAKSTGLRAGATHIMNSWHAAFPHTPIEFTTALPWGGGANLSASTADRDFLTGVWDTLGLSRGECSEQFHATLTHANTGLILTRTHGQEAVDSMHGRLGLGIYQQPQPNPLPADPQPIDDFMRAAYDDGVQHLVIFQEDFTSPNAATIAADRLLILSN